MVLRIFISSVMLCCFLSTFPLQSQTYRPRCGMDSMQTIPMGKTSLTNLNLGTNVLPHVTDRSQGESLHSLVLVARFPDDDDVNDYWPNPASMPTYIEDIVTRESGYVDGSSNNISDYWYLNSNGKLTLTGEVFYVTLPKNEEQYLRSVPCGYDENTQQTIYCDRLYQRAVIGDALQELSDMFDAMPRSFARFDRWGWQDGSGWVFDPDTSIAASDTLDLPIFIMRNVTHTWDSPPTFATGNLSDFSSNDGMKFKRGVCLSGPNMYAKRYLGEQGETFYGTLVHELGHLLIDFSMQYSTRLHKSTHFGPFASPIVENGERLTSSFTTYAPMAGNGYGNCTTYERVRGGWMDPDPGNSKYWRRVHETTNDDETYRLFEVNTVDPTSGSLGCTMIDIPLDNTSPEQSIILEYRNLDDQFEAKNSPVCSVEGSGPLASGVLAYHMINETNQVSATQAQIICADGNYDWNCLINAPDAEDEWHRWDLIDQGNPNPLNGYSDREMICIKDEYGSFIEDNSTYLTLWYPSFQRAGQGELASRGPYPGATNFVNQVSGVSDHGGDNMDLFTLGDVISPYTNPQTRVWDGGNAEFIATDLGIYVVGQGVENNKPYYDIRVVRGQTNINTLPPSAIQRARIRTDSPEECPKLEWDIAREPGIVTDNVGLYVIERSVDGGPWSLYRQFQHPTTEFFDSYDALSEGIHNISYRVYAKNVDGEAGPPSNPATINIAVGTLDATNAPNTFTGRDLHISGDVTVDLHLNIPGYTRINFCPNSTVYIDSSVTLKFVQTDENSHFVCLPGGLLLIDDSAHVDDLMYVEVEHDGTMDIKGNSVTRMHPAGKIDVYSGGYISATSGNPAVLSCYGEPTRAEPLDINTYWYGINFSEGSDGLLKHVTIRDAYHGVYSEYADYDIDSCLFTMNLIGIYATGGGPWVSNTHFDNCLYYGAGIFNMYNNYPASSLTFTHNNASANIVGFTFANTTVPIYGNTADENSTGMWFQNGVSSQFGYQYSEGFFLYCQTSRANSARYNSVDGIEMMYSSPYFLCDNSIHGNGSKDIDIHYNSACTGSKNYPANPVVSVDGTSSFTWTGPFPASDPLPKSSVAASFRPFSSSNPGLDSVLQNAGSAIRSRQYSPATSLLNAALPRIQSENGARHVFMLWQQAIEHGKLDTSSLDPISRGVINPYTLWTTRLTNLRTSHDSLWMRQSAALFLASHAAQTGQYQDALTLLESIHSDSLKSRAMDIQVLDALILYNMTNVKDTLTAYNQYLEFDRKYHFEKSRVNAKLRMGLILNEEDIRILKEQIPSPSPAAPQQQQGTDPLSGIEIRTSAFPNPFNPTTTITYDLPTDSKVYLAVYSLSGNHVATLVNEEQTKGAYTVPFSGELLPSGVYVYNLYTINLETRERHITQGNMMLTK